jgi:ribosome maturation factor RimP
MDKQAISDRLRTIAETVAAEAGVDLVHSEIAGTSRDLTARIFIDKPGGVTIDDCSEFSRKTEAILDADDFIPAAYVLEVSSPGIEREVYRPAGEGKDRSRDRRAEGFQRKDRRGRGRRYRP